MEHLAIMKKEWKFLEKILSGEKKIESRWYNSRRAPWDSIKEEEIVYFKNSGEPITLKAEVKKVVQFSDLDSKKVKEILTKYGRDDGIEKNQIPKFYKLFKDKKYCLLIFIKNPKPVKPFEVYKSGFGAMSAWLTVSNIAKIKNLDR